MRSWRGVPLHPQVLHLTKGGQPARVELSRNVFDHAERQIRDLLDADAFPRFVQFVQAQLQVSLSQSSMFFYQRE